MVTMSTKPDFKKSDKALEWAREKYAEREKELMGSVPPLEIFLISVVEQMAIQNRILEDIHKTLATIAPWVKEKL